jgi:hypothetical protein
VISTNPSQPQPGPSRSPYHVDFNNPAQTAVMEPDVLAFARHIGARSAVLSFLPGTEHTKLILSRPFRLPVTHPDIRAIKFDQTVEFNLDKTGGNLHFHGVRGIELDVGRFAPWVEANELFIRPDGSYDAAGIVLGVKSRRSGQAPIEVRDFCQKALDTLNRLLTQTP